MKNLLITGGAGFIGSHLCRVLQGLNLNITVLDNLSPQIHGHSATEPKWLKEYGINFIKGSVTSRDELENALKGTDAIVHLAAETGTGQSMYEIEKYNNVNSQATALMLDIIANKKHHNVKRILLASSRSVYGEGAYSCNNCDDVQRITPAPRTPQQLEANAWTASCPSCGSILESQPTKETDLIRPASIYASTKYAQEDLIAIACESLGIGYGILRLQNVYGEGQSLNNPYTGILSIFSTRIRRGLELPIFEDGLETRDFVHVEDVVHSFKAALLKEQSPNSIVNVGTGELTTVIDIATKLSLAFGKEPKIKVTGQYRLGDIRHNRADINKLKEVLDYTPSISLENGLSRFVNWVLEQPLPEDQLEKANKELKDRNLMG
ncbi:NAD-dependent epimerase/dehydratase family protein [Psychrosphaera haliotis]|uniref:NAD-dependent epimerase/dehydratase family protein n=1 Tax=Psychrosphaera haliotis TaxID=555083 RepID=A0A6N8F8G6_9GAMM|nr:NAD-dependent epimerase/dehydratase family protein [Psychrosphaera haliotis]MUH71377.1 NAD-dependent epimerase/dehydratase family protein [Psychrosphaera haliotis]